MTRFEYIPSGECLLASSIDLPANTDQDNSGQYPLVILVHGLTGHRLGHGYKFVELGRRLNEHGIACLRFDQAGCGESTGRFQDLTLDRMAADTAAVYRWVISQSWCDDTRIGLAASSLGALPLIAAESEKPASALVLWAPVFDMPRTFKATTKTGMRALLEHQGWVPYHGLPLGKNFVSRLDAIHTHHLLAQSNSPILIFHAPSDTTVGIQESESYEQRCCELGRPCSLIRVHNADHNFTGYSYREMLIDKTVQFFCEKWLPLT